MPFAPPPAAREVRIDGVLYATPFAALFRPLTPSERQDLAASIDADGVRVRVAVYDSPAHGPAIVDGYNRAVLAAAAGRPIPLDHHPGLTDGAARRLALSLNADRRQLTPSEQEAVRRGRIRRAAEMRAAGMSTRAIAAEEGVSQPQILRDLRDSDTPVSAPPVVTGRDGKTYPATRPAAAAVPDDADDAADDDTGRDAPEPAHFPGRPGVSRPPPAAPDPDPGPPPADLRGLALALLDLFPDRPANARVVAAAPDPADPNYPVTLGGLRAALGVPS